MQIQKEPSSLDHPATFNISGICGSTKEFQIQFLQKVPNQPELTKLISQFGSNSQNSTTYKAILTELFHQIEW